jgi:hypothetical protein
MYNFVRFLSLVALIGGLLLNMALNLFPGSLGSAFLSLFCAGEIVHQGTFDTLYCVEGNQRDPMTTLQVDIPVGLMIAGSLVLPLSYLFEMGGMSLRHERLLQTGQPGQARILALHQTGVRVNQQPMLKFDLEVIQGPGAPYPTSVSQVVNLLYLSHLSPGVLLNIKIDPHKPQNVAIDWNANFGNMASNAPLSYTSPPNQPLQTVEPTGRLKDKLQQLDEAKAAGLLTAQEYEAARQKLLEEFS